MATGGWNRVATALAALLLAPCAAAAVPERLSYQGKLLDAQGAPVADGAFGMEFRFYDSCDGGTLLLTDRHPAVDVRNGIYAVALGSGVLEPGVEASLGAVFLNHGAACLGVRIEDDDEMVPRLPILSAGYALRATVADDTVAGAVSAGSDVSWTGRLDFLTDITLADAFSVKWPHVSGSTPPSTGFRITKFTAIPDGQELHPNGESDEQFMICYNCRKGDTFREDLTQHSWNQKIEANYWNDIADREQLEVNWNYISPEDERYRPFAFVYRVTGHCTHDGSRCSSDATCGSGSVCEGANRSSFAWHTDPSGICAEDHQRPCMRNSDCAAECLDIKKTVMEADGRLWPWGGITMPRIYSGALATGSNAALIIKTDAEPADQGGTVRSIFSQLHYDENALPDSALASAVGVASQVWFTGDPAGRDILQDATGVSSYILLTQTGGIGSDGKPPTVERVYGFSFKLAPTGNHTVVRESVGLVIETPLALATSSPVDLREHHGILVEDQLGFGSLAGDAVLVHRQGGGAERGNLRLAGGSWDDGHLVLDDLHVWVDRTGGLLRSRVGAPVAEDDGRPLHIPPGTGADWGVIHWGTSDSPATDTGNEVCALAGLVCLETWDMGSNTSRNCSTAQHATSRFLALCHE